MYKELAIQAKANLILDLLKSDYPTVQSPMRHSNVYELLIAVMLSPQTNDDITNQVTPKLFAQYPTPQMLAAADEDNVLELIRSVNYNRTKAGRIVAAAKMLASEYNSKVPATMAELLTLPGVGRKVANVVINDWYATPASENPPYVQNAEQDPDKYNAVPRGSVSPTGFVVDTHVARVSQTLLLTKHSNPTKIEQDLMELFPTDEWMGTSLRMIFHGRQVFQAKQPSYKEFPKWQQIYAELLE